MKNFITLKKDLEEKNEQNNAKICCYCDCCRCSTLYNLLFFTFTLVPVSLDNSLVVIQSKNKKYLTVLTSGDEFIINDGKISYDDIKTLPVQVQSSTGDYFNIYTPTYKEFVLLMRRGPQIIYPKDVGSIIVDGNIKNNSTVLEIGTGSGALTLFLILILGKEGKLYSLDADNKNQYRAEKTLSLIHI